MHERRRLGGREPQFGHPDLDHLTGRAQPRQRQRRIGSRDEHDLGGWREMQQQESGLFVAAGFLDHLIVVKDENNWCLRCGQLVDQERYHRARDVRDRDPKRPEDLIDVEARAGSLQRVHDMPPQPAGVIVAAIEGDPSERPLFRRLARHCATRVVLPKPAGASMRTSLAAVAARTLMSARRSTHSLRKLGAWSLVSIGMSGSALDPGSGHRPQTALSWQACFAHRYPGFRKVFGPYKG